MAITVTASTGVVQTDTTQGTQIFRGNIVFSGNYVEGGDPVNLSTVFGIQSLSLPLEIEIIEKVPTGSTPGTYSIFYLFGTTPANGALFIKVNATGDELAAGAYPAEFTSGVFEIKAYFPCFV